MQKLGLKRQVPWLGTANGTMTVSYCRTIYGDQIKRTDFGIVTTVLEVAFGYCSLIHATSRLGSGTGDICMTRTFPTLDY